MPPVHLQQVLDVLPRTQHPEVLQHEGAEGHVERELGLCQQLLAHRLEQLQLLPLVADAQRQVVCGYVAAGVACAMRQMGQAFACPMAGMGYDLVSNFNSTAWITQSNVLLNITPNGNDETAAWLTGDQVQELVASVNPDGEGMSPAWLSGPGPMNYWRTMLSRTVADLNEANKVHIMVVNSENAYTLQETVSGVHWFVVAWFVAPPPAPEL